MGVRSPKKLATMVLYLALESTLLSGQAKLENEGWAVQAMGSDREGATSPLPFLDQ